VAGIPSRGLTARQPMGIIRPDLPISRGSHFVEHPIKYRF
jgi:hypothetical protein